jgi:glycyl-tRNA synthetase beta chain
MADLLVEIGTEELPARKVRPAAEALRDGLGRALADAGLLDAGAASAQPILGTPRRLAAFLPGVRERQADREEPLWGPPVAAAFGPDGKPTKAGEGFARTAGIPLEGMERREKAPGKPPYLYALKKVPGRAAAEVIAEALPKVLGSLPFARTMRWPQSDLPFARPIRGLVVLLGREVVPVTVAGCAAGRTVRGHRFLAPAGIDLPAASLDGYRDALRGARVLVEIEERTAAIRERVLAARGQEGDPRDGFAAADADLLAEVAGLVEWPRALVGTFDPRHLELPERLLTTCMAHHLRYFPVRDGKGGLQPKFVSVTDREEASSAGIRSGNERVLRARLHDAAFFFANDRKRRLEEFRPALAGVDFHRGLGTLLDKSERVRRIAGSLCETLKVPPAVRAAADRAAFLLKCDLLAEVVKEFPELQGAVGAHYARLDGEDPAAARALECQYLGGGSPDLLRLMKPEEARAAAVAVVADRVDTLAAYFSAGEEPTGSADPFGLRRAALALVAVFEAREWTLTLGEALGAAAREWKLSPEVLGRLRTFVWTRVEQGQRDAGRGDFLEAVAGSPDRPLREYEGRLRALEALSAEPCWRDLVAVVERTGNMGAAGTASPADLPPEGRALAEALREFRAGGGAAGDPAAFGRAFAAALGKPVGDLFDAVLVEDPEAPARTAALKHLLHEVHAAFAERLGDLRRLGGGARPPRA